MTQTPRAKITDVTASVNPTVNDDGTQALDVRSLWVNESNGKVFFCVNNAAGAAVWKDVTLTAAAGTHPVHASTIDPTINDDASLSFELGHHWINTTTQDIFQASDVTIGAAVWRPSSTNGATPAVNPGELMYGTLMDYLPPGNLTSGLVFYIRLKLGAGLEIPNMRTFIDSGGTGSRDIRMGIYEQTDPTDPDGLPVTRAAQTLPVATNGQNGQFMTEPLIGGSYTVLTTGYYWLAIVTDSTSLKFAVCNVARADFLPVRREAGTGTVLPATVGTISNPVGYIPYLAAVEA